MLEQTVGIIDAVVAIERESLSDSMENKIVYIMQHIRHPKR